MVIRFPVFYSPFSDQQTRNMYIYLPDDYMENISCRYPVLYMFDGHNVFFDSDATYGTSWRLSEYLQAEHTQLIVVAVECNHEGNCRLQEYSPFSFSDPALGAIRGRGREYMNWLLHTVKPQIDKKYRTLPDRTHTFLCGSSMGGLMALYGITAYNSFFHGAACLSPSLWVSPKQVNRMILGAKLQDDTVIYLDYGSKELKNHKSSRQALTGACCSLLEKGVNLTFRIIPGGMHCEASWRRQIPFFMDCLGIQ